MTGLSLIILGVIEGNIPFSCCHKTNGVDERMMRMETLKILQDKVQRRLRVGLTNNNLESKVPNML